MLVRHDADMLLHGTAESLQSGTRRRIRNAYVAVVVLADVRDSSIEPQLRPYAADVGGGEQPTDLCLDDRHNEESRARRLGRWDDLLAGA